MTKERELLSKALVYLSGLPARTNIQDDIEAYLSTTSDDAEEPVAYINLDEKRLEWAVPFEFKSSCFVLGKLPLYLHPPRPEPARKPMTASDEQKKRLEEK